MEVRAQDEDYSILISALKANRGVELRLDSFWYVMHIRLKNWSSSASRRLSFVGFSSQYLVSSVQSASYTVSTGDKTAGARSRPLLCI